MSSILPMLPSALLVVLSIVFLVRTIRFRPRISRIGFWLRIVLLPLSALVGGFLLLADWDEYRWHRTGRQRALLASMKSDLRNLVTAQENFHAQNGDFAGSITAETERKGQGGTGSVFLVASPGNVLMLSYVDSTGWWATMTNPDLDLLPIAQGLGKSCGIYVGSDSLAPNPKVVEPGAPACW